MIICNPKYFPVLRAIWIGGVVSLLSPGAFATQPAAETGAATKDMSNHSTAAPAKQPRNVDVPDFLRLSFRAAAGQPASSAEFRALTAKISEGFDAVPRCKPLECHWTYNQQKANAGRRLSLVQSKDEILLSLRRAPLSPLSAQDLLTPHTITATSNGRAIGVISYSHP
jgi:hypothetical protein